MNIADLRKKSRQKAADTDVAAGKTPPPPLPPFAPPVAAAGKTPAGDRSPAKVPPVAEQPLRQRLDDLFTDCAQNDENSEAHSLSGAWSQERATVVEFKQMLSFSLGSEEYALDIHDIREIIKPREITEIPRVPDFILGIISLRGIVVPVFDLKRRFKLGTSILSPTSRIIVCQRDNKSAGLLVDSISQVVRIPHVSIEPPPLIFSGLERELLEGVGRYRERMLILLNTTCVLNTDLI